MAFNTGVDANIGVRNFTLKGLCKAKSLHLHIAEKSKNILLKFMAYTCC